MGASPNAQMALAIGNARVEPDKVVLMGAIMAQTRAPFLGIVA